MLFCWLSLSEIRESANKNYIKDYWRAGEGKELI
jgi:hypothetical protein